MKSPIYFIDRINKEKKLERVYGDAVLDFLYGGSLVGKILAFLMAYIPLFSVIYGFFQRLPFSKRKIAPFIKKFGIDESEFLTPSHCFKSFDAFFTRKLKQKARPICHDPQIAIIPADGRFLFYPRIDQSDGFIVKGKKFSLEKLLGDPSLATSFAQGSLVLGRLCPTDYHRFHFPCDCIPSRSELINGPLYSVNPIAVKQNLSFLFENKRMITELETSSFGKVIFIEIGATSVGTIHQTYSPFTACKKGDEKGFFSFGGSSLVLLFEPGRIRFDDDLVKNSSLYIETLCQMGQSMGRS